jgi:hypothetical protein
VLDQGRAGLGPDVPHLQGRRARLRVVVVITVVGLAVFIVK